MADAAGQRYAAWQGTYRLIQRPPALSARRRAVIGGLVVVALALAVWWTVHRVQALGWSGFPLVWVWVLFSPFWWVVEAWRPAGTRVTAAGLTVRPHVLRERTVAWEDVVEVRPAGRFEDHPAALLTGGRRLELLGLPADVAEAMAAVTRPEPEPEPVRRTSPRRPAPGEDLDGPFHRGPARR